MQVSQCIHKISQNTETPWSLRFILLLRSMPVPYMNMIHWLLWASTQTPGRGHCLKLHLQVFSFFNIIIHSLTLYDLTDTVSDTRLLLRHKAPHVNLMSYCTQLIKWFIAYRIAQTIWCLWSTLLFHTAVTICGTYWPIYNIFIVVIAT